MKTVLTHQALSLKRDHEHQVEFVAEYKGVSYINDSRSVDIRQTVQSIDSIDAEIVLIIGGDDEKTDYTCFLNISLKKIKRVVYLGRYPEKLFRIFGKEDCLFVTAGTVEEGVIISQTVARQNQVVLFSPACPSYEAFDNYKNRGNAFKQLVSDLDKL
jgi:UDP-N-acetylmuramoylalanine--D-glutamate ligase